MIDTRTPVEIKAMIAGALMYFVSPLDVIPDILGPAGFVDDAAVIASTLAAVSIHITDDHRRKAEEFFEHN